MDLPGTPRKYFLTYVLDRLGFLDTNQISSLANQIYLNAKQEDIRTLSQTLIAANLVGSSRKKNSKRPAF